MPAPKSGDRQHFGKGALAVDPSRSVFLNCPFDQEYRQLFDALILVTVCAGFMPRSALETGSVAQSRMERILGAVFSSKYSLHDLSRCQGQGDANLARFNMPLELGFAMARSHLAERTGEAHDWLVLVPEGHEYARFVSDIAGFDPKTHDGTVEKLVPSALSWLATREDAVQVPSPADVLSVMPDFQVRLQQLREDWQDQPPWADLVLTAIAVARPLID